MNFNILRVYLIPYNLRKSIFLQRMFKRFQEKAVCSIMHFQLSFQSNFIFDFHSSIKELQFCFIATFYITSCRSKVKYCDSIEKLIYYVSHTLLDVLNLEKKKRRLTKTALKNLLPLLKSFFLSPTINSFFDKVSFF